MSRDVIAIFDGTFEGFLCVVYEYYYNKITPLIIQTEDRVQLTLTDEVYRVETDSSRATRVYNGIKEKISEDAARRVYLACLSGDEDKYMTIFQYVLRGFTLGHMVDSHLTKDYVKAVHSMAGRVGGEAHKLNGFCRFAETTSGIMYCEITPKNDVLPLIAPHFSQRLMNLRWVIHDKSRHQAAIYDGESYIITDVPPNIAIEYAEGEDEIQDLWIVFFNSLSIKARENPKLQRQMLPLYYRKNMTEFNRIPGSKSRSPRKSSEVAELPQNSGHDILGLPEKL